MKQALHATGIKSKMSASSKDIVSDKSLKVLASAIYRQLQDEGCDARNIISVSSQLIDLVTTAIQKDDPNTPM